MKTKPRFVAIVTPAQDKQFRVYDRVTGENYCPTDDYDLAKKLAADFTKKYAAPWYRRLIAFITRRPLPQPIPDPAETELEPEWKTKIRAINELVARKKEETRLAGGGHIEEFDNFASISDNN